MVSHSIKINLDSSSKIPHRNIDISTNLPKKLSELETGFIGQDFKQWVRTRTMESRIRSAIRDVFCAISCCPLAAMNSVWQWVVQSTEATRHGERETDAREDVCTQLRTTRRSILRAEKGLWLRHLDLFTRIRFLKRVNSLPTIPGIQAIQMVCLRNFTYNKYFLTIREITDTRIHFTWR